MIMSKFCPRQTSQAESTFTDIYWHTDIVYEAASTYCGAFFFAGHGGHEGTFSKNPWMVKKHGK